MLHVQKFDMSSGFEFQLPSHVMYDHQGVAAVQTADLGLRKSCLSALLVYKDAQNCFIKSIIQSMCAHAPVTLRERSPGNELN